VAPQPILVWVTTASESHAEHMAGPLLGEQLIDRVSISPHRFSLCHRCNNLECQEESPLVLETTTEGLAPRFEARTRLRTYDIPETIPLPVLGEGKDYLSWLARTVRPIGPPEVPWRLIDVSRPPAYTVDCRLRASA
jgi:uncharacterized protein involved in tolerance to divalent cations